MSDFNNIQIDKAANVYFDGNVTSRTIRFPDDSIKTLGIMLPGEYEFNTDVPELMEITSGSIEVLLPNESNWITVVGGESFNVDRNSKFRIKIKTITDYCCSYLN